VSKLAVAPIARGLLTEVVNHYADAAVALPERRCLVPGAPGAVAWDCEQVTLALAQLSVDTGGNQASLLPMAGSAAGVMLTRLATFAIQVVRCSPVSDDEGTPPAPELLETAALTAYDDVGMLSQLLVEVAALVPGTRSWLPIGSRVNAGQVASLGPEGGMQAVEATVTVSAMVTE
jgi:hypothetical protein